MRTIDDECCFARDTQSMLAAWVLVYWECLWTCEWAVDTSVLPGWWVWGSAAPDTAHRHQSRWGNGLCLAPVHDGGTAIVTMQGISVDESHE